MLKTIRAQLIALVALAFAIVLLVGGVGLYASNQLDKAAAKAAGYSLAAQNQTLTSMLLDNLRGLVDQHASAVKDNNSERIADLAKSLKENAKKIRSASRANDGFDVLGTDSTAFAARLAPLFEDYAKAAEAIAAGPVGDPAELERSRAAFNTKFSVLEKEQNAFNKSLQSEIALTKDQAAQTVQSTSNLLTLAVVFGLALLGLAAFWVYRSITSGLSTLEATMSKVNLGDVSARTDMVGDDELSQMGRTFDNLLDDRVAALAVTTRENEVINNSAINLLQAVYSLSEKDLTARAMVSDDIVGTIASSVNQFADETGTTLVKIKQIAAQLQNAAMATQQQGVVVQGAAQRERGLLESMGVTLVSASHQLKEVAQLSTASGAVAARTSEATKAAQVAVEGSMRGMDSLREVISETEKRFKRLSERSQEISSAVALVNTISERTHVLSLNASMQAATAGEAGRGFAVVAQEVQRLSDSSRQATGEIAKLVSNIQAETNETLITMNRLIADVVAQTDLARRAGHEMGQTRAATNELVALVQQIASFAEQQQKMSQTLQQNVQGMNDGTAQTSSAISLQSNATDTLLKFAQRLNETVAEFKVKA